MHKKAQGFAQNKCWKKTWHRNLLQRTMSEKVGDHEQVNCGTVLVTVSLRFKSRPQNQLGFLVVLKHFSHTLILSLPQLEGFLVHIKSCYTSFHTSCNSAGQYLPVLKNSGPVTFKKECLPVHSAGCQMVRWIPVKTLESSYFMADISISSKQGWKTKKTVAWFV